MNPLYIIFILGVSAIAVANAVATSKAGNKSSIKILNLDRFRSVGSEFEISLTIAIDNPTMNNLNIKKPYLTAYYNEREVANSLPSGEMINVKGNSRTVIKNVNIRIPFSNLPALVGAVFSKKFSDQAISLKVESTANGFSVSDKKDFKFAEIIKLFTALN